MLPRSEVTYICMYALVCAILMDSEVICVARSVEINRCRALKLSISF